MKALINLYNRIIRGIALYPRAILPRKNFIPQINFVEYLSNYKFLTVRRTSKKPTDAFDEHGVLRVDALISDLKDVPEMSLSLLGGLFQLKHLKYVPKGEASKKWTSGNNIKLSYLKKTFEIENEIYPIFFILNEICNQEIPVKRRTDDIEIKKLYKCLNKTLPHKEFVDLTGVSLVSHEPVNFNYWHIEFLLKDLGTNQPVKRKSIRSSDDNYWQNNLALNAVNDLLIVKAKRDIADIDYYEIPKKLYTIKS